MMLIYIFRFIQTAHQCKPIFPMPNTPPHEYSEMGLLLGGVVDTHAWNLLEVASRNLVVSARDNLDTQSIIVGPARQVNLAEALLLVRASGLNVATLLIRRLLPKPYDGCLKSLIHREKRKADLALTRAKTGTPESRAAFLSSPLFANGRPILMRPSRSLGCKDDDAATEVKAAAKKASPTDDALVVIEKLFHRRDIDDYDKTAIILALSDDPINLSIQIVGDSQWLKKYWNSFRGSDG
jgi:hypothetical protein